MREFIPENAKPIPENAECVFRGKIFDVYQWPQEMFDGTVETFEMLRRADTVEVITILEPDEQARLIQKWKEYGIKGDFDISKAELRAVITDQIQPGQKWFYAYPGGRVDGADENEKLAAQRELREETGISCREWKLLDVHQPFAKADWLIYTFLAQGLDGVAEQELDGGEKIRPILLTFDELRTYAAKKEAKYLWPEWLRGIRSFEELRRIALI